MESIFIATVIKVRAGGTVPPILLLHRKEPGVVHKIKSHITCNTFNVISRDTAALAGKGPLETPLL